MYSMFPKLWFLIINISFIQLPLSSIFLPHSTPATLVFFLFRECQFHFHLKAFHSLMPLPETSFIHIFTLFAPSHHSFLYTIPSQGSLLDHLLKKYSPIILSYFLALSALWQVVTLLKSGKLLLSLFSALFHWNTSSTCTSESLLSPW